MPVVVRREAMFAMADDPALRQAIAIGTVDREGDVMRAPHRMNRAERDPEEPDTLERWEAYHREFHLTLIAGRRMPLNVCSVLLNLNDRYRRSFLRRTPGGDRNVAYKHGEIAQGAVARDADFACDSSREHTYRTGTNLQRHLADRLGP
jgi:DNA-binding GntR family transcriptional regulator